MNNQQLLDQIQSIMSANHLQVKVALSEDESLINFTWFIPDGRMAGYAIFNPDFADYETLPTDWADMIAPRTKVNIECAELGLHQSADVITIIEEDGAITDHYATEPSQQRWGTNETFTFEVFEGSQFTVEIDGYELLLQSKVRWLNHSNQYSVGFDATVLGEQASEDFEYEMPESFEFPESAFEYNTQSVTIELTRQSLVDAVQMWLGSFGDEQINELDDM